MTFPNFIVGIGGSAGGLAAYKDLLDALTPRTGMAFVIVTHLIPNANSQLALILARHTKMKITVATTGMSIRRNHVYVIPPDADLFMEGVTLKVVSPRSGRNIQIDLFFASLAESMGAHAIGVILSGYDGDGTEGCRQIKARGGTTFSQDASAGVTDMPRHAESAGNIDFVLSPAKIANELQRMARDTIGHLEK
jgi:two-component system CheB/CheR fusion protein